MNPQLRYLYQIKKRAKVPHWIVLFVILASSISASAITGGRPAKEGEFPFLVSLHAPIVGLICSGSLISSQWILTAGHCAAVPFVRVKYQGKFYPVEKRVIHPQFNKDRAYSYDVGLIKIKDKIQTQLMALNDVSPSDQVNSLLTIVGWGDSDPFKKDRVRYLRSAQVPLVDPTRCQSVYKERVDESMICAGFDQGGVDSCDRDSGGPMFTVQANGTPLAIGIVSWADTCAQPLQFGVYSAVHVFADWIRNTTLENQR